MKNRLVAMLGMSVVSLGLAGCSEFPQLSASHSLPIQLPMVSSNSSVASHTDASSIGQNGTQSNSTGSNAPQQMSINTAHKVTTVPRRVTLLAVPSRHNLNALAHLTGVPILTYHDVSGKPNNPWSLTPVQFEEQMAYLYKNGYHVIPLSALYEKLFAPTHTQLPVKPIVITFDDGYESNYSVAYPILEKYKFPATIFMVSNFAGRPDFMTWTQLQAMQAGGIVDIESHTVNHVHLAKLSMAQVELQLVDSKKAIQDYLKKPVNFFCYPFDSYSASVVREVEAAGYQMAVTDNFGLANVSQSRYTVDRVEVLSTFTLPEFEVAVTGRRPAVAGTPPRRA